MVSEDDDRIAPALDALLRSDAGDLRIALEADPDLVNMVWQENTLLEWTTQPPGGIGDEAIQVLIDAGASLDRSLNLAGCWNRAELCGQLLAAGADPAARADAGITPLESAAMHGSADAADVLVAHGLHRPTLWLAAASGLLENVKAWVPSAGLLNRAFDPHRPDWASVGRPTGSPPGDSDEELIDEAFVFAAANGRIDVVDYLAASGADVDARPYGNTTALHFAIQLGKPDTVERLLRLGARRDIVDDQYNGTAAGWAAACDDGSPTATRIRAAIERGGS